MSPEAQRLLLLAQEWQQLATAAQAIARDMQYMNVPAACVELARTNASRLLVLAAALEGVARRGESS